MKPVLVLQHRTNDNLGYLATWLKTNNITYQVYNAEIHKEFPTSIEPYSALAVMGGSMSANDPLLTNRQAEILILQAMYRDIPVIGHCLGGQLMAKALGAKIITSPYPEIGWQNVTYIDNDLTKEWYGYDPTTVVMHWHYEAFEMPAGATLLSTNNNCMNQSFAIDKHLAMQFHIEIDDNKIDIWTKENDTEYKTVLGKYKSVQTVDEIYSDAKIYLGNHIKTANIIYKNWLKTTDWNEFLRPI